MSPPLIKDGYVISLQYRVIKLPTACSKYPKIHTGGSAHQNSVNKTPV